MPEIAYVRRMSMSICLAKVSPVLAERIETDPELLNQVWLEADSDEPPVGASSEIAAIDRDRDLLCSRTTSGLGGRSTMIR
jgi:hypothetical protein